MVVTIGRIVVYKRTAFNGDSSGFIVDLIKNVVESFIVIIGLEESTLDNNVTAIGLDYRVTYAVSVSADSEISAFDRYGCAVSYLDSLIVSARAAVKRSAFDSNFSVIFSP